MADLEQVLESIGLSQKEASVYLALLSLGPEKPTVVASRAGIKRTTVYPVLESLKDKGLVSEVVKGFKKLYVAENPERLESIMDQRVSRLKSSLGEFSALYNLKSGESSIKHYEGIESVIKEYDKLLEDVLPGDDYLIISSPDEWYRLQPKFFKDFIERRAKLDLKIRCLVLDSKRGRDYRDNGDKYNLRAKILPDNYSFTANIVIIPKKILIHQIQPPVWAIVIENSALVKTHQELFEMIWQSLP